MSRTPIAVGTGSPTEGTPTPIPTISSLAILKVNFDQQGQDFIDNFVPFVVEVLRGAGRSGATTLMATESLRASLGITIPEGAVSSVLRRATRRGLAIARGNGVYALSDQGEQLPELAVSRESVARDGRALINRLVEFSNRHLDMPWTAGEAEMALVRFASERGARVLATRGALVDTAPPREARDEDHLLGEFVLHLRQTDAVGFGYLEALIKGALLASAMYYPDLGRLQSRFQRLDVYLDTRLVLRALGTAGPEHEAASREFLDLLYELGASLGVFDNTLLEVRGVLAAASGALRQATHLRVHSGESLEYMASIGYRASDVELINAQVERRLRTLRVTVRPRPPYVDRLGVDELRLERLLKDGRLFGRPYPEEALRHDVAAVTAIHRLRGGRAQPVLENAESVFVTTNALLARVSTDFFRDQYGAAGVPLCYVDYQFATLAWLKKPTAAPTLPMLQVIADSYAALNPPDGLWRAYLAEIARLEARGDISAEDYYSLRFTMAAKSALIDLADPGEAMNETIPEILARTKETLRREIEQASGREPRVDGMAEEELSMRSELDSLRHQAQADRSRREARLRGYSASLGRFVSRSVLIVGSLAVAVVAYLGSAPVLPTFSDTALAPYRPLLFLVGIFVLVLVIANTIFGTSLKSVSRELEVRVTRRVSDVLERRLL